MQRACEARQRVRLGSRACMSETMLRMLNARRGTHLACEMEGAPAAKGEAEEGEQHKRKVEDGVGAVGRAEAAAGVGRGRGTQLGAELARAPAGGERQLN